MLRRMLAVLQAGFMGTSSHTPSFRGEVIASRTARRDGLEPGIQQ
jgi:hypothetical protein